MRLQTRSNTTSAAGNYRTNTVKHPPVQPVIARIDTIKHSPCVCRHGQTLTSAAGNCRTDTVKHPPVQPVTTEQTLSNTHHAAADTVKHHQCSR